MKRVNSGIYEEIFKRHRVEVRKLDPQAFGDDASACWIVIVDGDYWNDYPTKREAVEAFRNEL